jgi:hypothetical protein
MKQELIEYLSVYLISMFKFVGGPVLGAGYGLSFLATVVATVLGMMTTVVIMSFFGLRLRAWMTRRFNVGRKKFTRRNRRIIYIWRRYGIFGISFLTPVIFSPIIGTLLVTAFGGKRKKVLLFMLISACFWALVITSLSDVIVAAFF